MFITSDSKNAPYHWRNELNFTEVQNIQEKCRYLLTFSNSSREAPFQESNGSHIGMASKSQIFEFLHHSLNFGAFFIVLICDVHFVELVLWLVQQNDLYKSKQ